MADRDVKVTISAEDNLSPVMQKAIENMANLHTEAINLNTGLELLHKGAEIAKVGFEVLKEIVGKSIEEALAAEKAQTRLSGALIATGNYTEKAIDSLNAYTEELEKNTGANGEAVKSMIATGVQLGLTVEKAKDMELAARQLAAATGTTTEEAFQRLQSSLAGNARSLGMVIPQVKELGAAQLKTGEAIDIVIKATAAQYAQYQESLPAAIAKATNAYNDLYKAFGQTITASPALQSTIASLAVSLRDLGKFIENNKEEITAFVNDGVIFAINSLQILQNTIDVLYRTGSAAFNSLAAVINGAFAAVSKSLEVVLTGLSYIPGAAGRAAKEGADALKAMYEVTWAATKQNASNVVDAVENQTTASKALTNALEGTKEAAVGAMKAHDGNTEAMKKAAEAASDLNGKNLALQQSFAGISIGNDATRKQLQAEAEDYKKSLTDFKTYYDSKIQIAVDKETFQQAEIARVRAESLKGTGGAQEKTSGADAEVQAEEVKQQQLAEKRKLGVLNDAQYREALLASQQRQAQLSLQMAQADQAALADALGESPAGFQLRQQMLQQNFQEEQALKMARAQEAGATEEQLRQMEAAGHEEMLAQKEQLEEQYYEKEAERRQRSGDDFGAFLSKMKAQQAKEGAAMGTLHAVQNSAYFKTEMGMLGNLSSLRSSHSKGAFEMGKKAAIAQATVQTFLSATEAFAAMASIPIIGPVLGAAAAAAAVAAGFVQIQNISSQQFAGGQADQGMDAIPGALAGRSFILSAGERVVQPEANKKLTSFLDQEMGDGKTPSGNGARGSTMINITVSPGVTQPDAQKAVEIMMAELRKASERGQPIINEKGIVYNNR